MVLQISWSFVIRPVDTASNLPANSSKKIILKFKNSDFFALIMQGEYNRNIKIYKTHI